MAEQTELTCSKSNLLMQTQILNHKCAIEWRISDFTKHHRNIRIIRSEEFSPVPWCTTKWRITLRFVCGCMAISFERMDRDETVQGMFELSLENSRREVYYQKSSRYPYFHELQRIARPSSRHVVWYWRWTRKFKLLEDDVFVVRGSMDLLGCCTVTKTVREF